MTTNVPSPKASTSSQLRHQRQLLTGGGRNKFCGACCGFIKGINLKKEAACLHGLPQYIDTNILHEAGEQMHAHMYVRHQH